MSAAADNWILRHRLTVNEYYRMAESGLLAPDARVELVEGEIIDMAPIGTAHSAIVNRLNRILHRAVGDRAILSVQQPVRLSDRSEPEPDLALLKPQADFYASRHPTAADILLLIEVSDSSLRYDREIKVPLYAKYDIPELWIFDLEGKSLHTYRLPKEGAYADQSSSAPKGLTPITTLPGVSIDLNGVF